MIVCVCNALREREVREAVRSGCKDPLSAYASLGCRPRCGQCVPYVREMISTEDQAA
jgi:bacterioferritin-associated ferredoxin